MACYRFEQKLCGIQLQPDVFGPAERQVRMIISVVPDLVSFVDDATDKPRVAFRVHSHEEEGRLYIRCFENVQDLRCPSRVGTVIESDGDLMLAAGALVIKRWELRKLDVSGVEITVCIHGELSGPIHAILINRHNFAVADVSYCVAGWYDFERLSRWIVEFEISRDA